MSKNIIFILRNGVVLKEISHLESLFYFFILQYISHFLKISISGNVKLITQNIIKKKLIFFNFTFPENVHFRKCQFN